MMHADAPHPNCAYMWLEHSINPKLQGDLAAWFGSVPAVLSACKGNALLTDKGCETNGVNNFEKIHFWRTPVAKCTSQDCRLRALLSLGHRHDRSTWRPLTPSRYNHIIPGNSAGADWGRFRSFMTTAVSFQNV